MLINNYHWRFLFMQLKNEYHRHQNEVECFWQHSFGLTVSIEHQTWKPNEKAVYPSLSLRFLFMQLTNEYHRHQNEVGVLLTTLAVWWNCLKSYLTGCLMRSCKRLSDRLSVTRLGLCPLMYHSWHKLHFYKKRTKFCKMFFDTCNAEMAKSLSSLSFKSWLFWLFM